MYKLTLDELYHSGVKGQKWGKQNGPPYPLSANQHSALEKKHGTSGWSKSAQQEAKRNPYRSLAEKGTKTDRRLLKKKAKYMKKSTVAQISKNRMHENVLATRSKYQPKIDKYTRKADKYAYRSLKKLYKGDTEKTEKLDIKENKYREKVSKYEHKIATKVSKAIKYANAEQVYKSKLSDVDSKIQRKGSEYLKILLTEDPTLYNYKSFWSLNKSAYTDPSTLSKQELYSKYGKDAYKYIK